MPQQPIGRRAALPQSCELTSGVARDCIWQHPVTFCLSIKRRFVGFRSLQDRQLDRSRRITVRTSYDAGGNRFEVDVISPYNPAAFAALMSMFPFDTVLHNPHHHSTPGSLPTELFSRSNITDDLVFLLPPLPACPTGSPSGRGIWSYHGP